MGLVPAYYHGHDWPYMYPYSQPLYWERVRAICATESLKGPQPDWPAGYFDLSFTNITGYDGWGDKPFFDAVDRGDIRYSTVPTVESQATLVVYGRVDCVLSEIRSFKYNKKRVLASPPPFALDIAPREITIGPIITRSAVHVGYSKAAFEAGSYPYFLEFMQAFDNALHHMQVSGEIEEIMNGKIQ